MDARETYQLIRKVQKGDSSAFEKLARVYMPLSFRIANRILGNRYDAHDAVQDSWIKIWKNISDFRKKAGFKTWMYRIVTNTCMDFLKKKKRNPEVFEPIHEKAMITADHTQNPETLFVVQEQLAQLRQLIDTLPATQRLVFVLRDLEGLSPDEVGMILNLDKDVLKSHLYHARKAIRLKAEKIKIVEERYYDLRKN